MAIDFPNSPATNDTHTVGDKTWIYADGKWSTSTGVSTTNASLLVSGTLDNARLPAVATTITTVGTLGSLAVTGDLTVDTTTLKVDSTNNRVGVNTASPVTAVDVVGTATVRAAATQDGVALAGRAGGTSTYEVTLTPTTLTADRTLTLPDDSGTVATTINVRDTMMKFIMEVI